MIKVLPRKTQALNNTFDNLFLSTKSPFTITSHEAKLKTLEQRLRHSLKIYKRQVFYLITIYETL